MAKFGPIEVYFRSEKKSYSDSYSELVAILAREKGYTDHDPRTLPQKQLLRYDSWVSSVVSLITNRISCIDFKFYDIVNKNEIPANTHGFKDFTKPFTEPNSLMSYSWIKTFCQLQLDTCGMAMIYPAKNKLGQVWELWPLSMNDYQGYYVDYASENVFVPDVYYYFSILGRVFMFKESELIVLKYPHPRFPWAGCSPIALQMRAIDLERFIEHYEGEFFKNSARPDFAISTEQALDDEKASSIKERWNSIYQGNFHDVAVLDNGTTITPLNFINRDMQLVEMAGWTEDMILAAYHTNKAKLGQSGEVNRSNSVFVDIAWNTDCIAPRLQIWDEQMTKKVIWSYNKKIIMRHDNPIPRDRQLETQESKAYCGVSTLSINEIRKNIHDVNGVKDGDRILIPNTYIFLDRLDELIDAQIKSRLQPKITPAAEPSADPHANDKPHLNPDGSDDRDNNPTEGRNIDPELYLREVWREEMNKFLNNATEEIFVSQSEYQIKKLVNSTVLYIFKSAKQEIPSDTEWKNSYVYRAAKELEKSILYDFNKKSGEVKWEDFIKNQAYSNPKIAKICNTCLRSAINYSKFQIITAFGLEKKWVIDRNVCGHCGRIKSFQTKDFFVIGNTKLQFPGESFNLDCDCQLSFVNADIKLLEK